MTTSPDTPKIIGVPGSEPSRQESLIEYPSQFPIKVMRVSLRLQASGLLSEHLHPH